MGKYSETMMDHVLSPRNGGVMEHPDLTGHAGTPGKGAFLILFLRLDEGRIAAASYHTVGCGPTIACGSMLSELVVGRSIENCQELTAEYLIEALDGVPPDKLHCPAMAIAALRDALSHWQPRMEDGAGLATDCTDTADARIEWKRKIFYPERD
jgi:nitrogen fixation NifU-like protein